MDEAHGLGTIHRDLKPSNLFACEANGRRVLKVLDFGISKITTEEDEKVTRTQSSFGTPLYISPEPIRSAKHVHSRADIWALGVLFCTSLSPPAVRRQYHRGRGRGVDRRR